MNKKQTMVLVAEDDADDRLLIQKAFTKGCETGDLVYVEDGDQLMRYLKRQAPYNNEEKYPRPQIVLLDLNMPKKDGREALKEIKSDKELCKIPVIIFTTSKQQEDIESMYMLGSNSYITKPSSFDGLLSIAKEIETYWFHTVELPVS
ncbi:MAG: response regulator [Chitinophagaceae bacterium]|nr:response regulator [Chitinophagaceae bacterium]